MNHDQPPYRQPAPPPPEPPPRVKRPWYETLLLVIGILVAIAIVAIVALLGFVAFACSRH